MGLNALTVGAALPQEWSPSLRYPLAQLAAILSREDAITAARAVAELARLLELDPDVLGDLIRREPADL